LSAMGFIITAVRYLAYVVLFLFSTVCLACGLYYLAELIEEHEKTTKKVLKCAILVVIGVHVLVWFEGFPLSYLSVGIFTHLIFYKLLDKFPDIKLTNVLFIMACILFLVSHSLWFNFFTTVYFQFEDVFGFFMLCVWTVPFAFFISLTTDDANLPSYGAISASGENIGDRRRGKSNIVTHLLQSFQRILPWEKATEKISLLANDDKSF